MDDYFLIYRTPVLKHIITLFIVSSLIMILFIVIFSPGIKNIDLIISALITIRNYLIIVYSALIGGYLLQLVFSYQELYFFNEVITLRNIFGKKISCEIKKLVKVSQSRAAYNFHFEMPEEKIYALDCFYGPQKFEDVLFKIINQRIDKRNKIIFEYGKTQKVL